MNFFQSQHGQKVKIECLEDGLSYSSLNWQNQTETAYTMSYADIEVPVLYYKIKNFYILLLSFVFMLAGIWFAVYGYRHGIINSLEILGTFWAMGGVMLSLFFLPAGAFLFRVKGFPPIRILDDKNHEQIITEIQKRRKDFLRKKYATIESFADPAHEFDKFGWLWRCGIITEQEYSALVEKLETLYPRNMTGSAAG